MRKYVERFHYLTQDLPDRTHREQVQTACESGAKWIQYRCLTKDDAALTAEISELAAICDDWGTTLVLTDHYHLLDRVDAQGVHIEDFGADLVSVRKAIGEDKTLGASAVSLEQIRHLAALGVVDYIGCGPFAKTLTKPNDFPLLGVDGYREIISAMQAEGIEIPVLAVGGIRPEDAGPLLRTGIYGLAVSGAINLAADPKEAFMDFYNKVY